MANHTKGLGRGLGALLGSDTIAESSSKASTLPISKVEPKADQPRTMFDEVALQELSESIKQHGIIQPITVRKLPSGYYQIIAGERRWRAARLANFTEVPAVVIEADDNKAMELETKAIDVVWNGMTLTEEVKKLMGTAEPYCNNGQQEAGAFGCAVRSGRCGRHGCGSSQGSARCSSRSRICCRWRCRCCPRGYCQCQCGGCRSWRIPQ